MPDIQELIDAVNAFRDERDWRQFHDPKELAVALSIEAVEVLELFRYKSKKESIAFAQTHLEDVADELADVLYHVLALADDLQIDLGEAMHAKLTKTALKYPIEKAKGKAIKYTEL